MQLAYTCEVVKEAPTATSGPSARRRIGINAQLLAQERSYRHAGVSRYIDNLLKCLLREDSEADYTVFLGGRSPLRYAPGTLRSALPLSLEQGRAYRERRSRLPTQNPWVRLFWEQCIQPLQLRASGIELLHSPVNVQPLVLPCKGVVTATDLSFMVFPRSFRTFQRLYQRFFTRWSARRADHLIAISASTARDLVKFFGVPATKITVTYPGVDAAYRPITDAAVLSEFRRRRNLPDKFFLFVGTLEPRKNLLTLLRAYATFRRAMGGTHKLVLAGGRGWLYRPLFSAVEELGLQTDVVFPGFVPEEELPLWYNTAEALVYPSLYEGFGLPPLEAMACGTAVVVADASSLPEVVSDAGLRIDPHRVEAWTEALVQLCQVDGLRADLASRGLQRAREFTWTRMARETIQVYRNVLAGGA